jgi:1,4-dihydroxy-2-naphthoyl-CoA hydrolase
MDVDLDALNARMTGLPAYLGIRFVEASRDRLVAELTITDNLRTRGGRPHGGTLMSLADTVGAVATTINLPPNTWTTTLESKTNFIAAGQGDLVRAEATPLHRGRTTMVWQTRVTDATGRLISQTIQTQMVLPTSPTSS